MRVVVLSGDGIGPEVTAAATRVLAELAPDLALAEHPFGAEAIRTAGMPLPDETLAACRRADAVLKGPIGDPEFDAADVRPEQGLLQLRSELGVYANLRPARAEGVDLLTVRELVGGLYYGARGVRADGTVYDTCELPPGPGRAHRAPRLRARTGAARPADLRRQGERARDVAALAARGERAGP